MPYAIQTEKKSTSIFQIFYFIQKCLQQTYILSLFTIGLKRMPTSINSEALWNYIRYMKNEKNSKSAKYH